jgi:hypothetical protein
MSAYFALSSTSKPADLARVFAMKAKDVTWKGLDGAVPVTDLGARLDEPTPTLTPVSFIVGGDAMSARGVWTATPAQAGAPGLIYAVDFESQPNALLGFSWRIWHMAVFTADDPPATPGAYCHYDPDQAW